MYYLILKDGTQVFDLPYRKEFLIHCLSLRQDDPRFEGAKLVSGGRRSVSPTPHRKILLTTLPACAILFLDYWGVINMSYTDGNVRFSIDWINLRVRRSVNDVMEWINSTYSFSFAQRKPLPFYDNGLYLVDAGGTGCVVLCWNEDEDGNLLVTPTPARPHDLFVSISGDGCRFLQNECLSGLRGFLRDLVSGFAYEVTRIDLAADFFDKNNGIVPLIQGFGLTAYTDDPEKLFVCRLPHDQNFCHIDVVWDDDLKDNTFNVTVGSRHSKKGQMQLYNKKMEQKKGRLSSVAQATFDTLGVTDYWWRLEYRIKAHATEIFDVALKSNPKSAYLAAVTVFGRFVDNIYKDGCHQNQCPVSDDWQEFLSWLESDDSIDFVELVSVPYIPASVESSVNWSSYNAALVYKIFKLSIADPLWFQELLKDGRRRYMESPRHKPFRKEFDEVYAQQWTDVSESLRWDD